MKGIIFTVCFQLFLVSISFSQESKRADSLSSLITFPKHKKDIRILVLKTLDKYINSNELFGKQRNNVVLFSVGVSIDSLGNVDDIFFSDNVAKNKTKIIIGVVNLVSDLKKMHLDDFHYQSSILIIPMLFKRPEDDKISNLKEFLDDFSSLWPKINTNSVRKIVLFEPLINNFFDPVN